MVSQPRSPQHESSLSQKRQSHIFPEPYSVCKKQHLFSWKNTLLFPSQILLCGGKTLLAVCLMLICVLPGDGWQDATTSLQIVLAEFACSGLVTSFILSFLLLWYSYFSLAHIPRHMEMSRVSRTGAEHARRYWCSTMQRADTKCPVCTKLRAKYSLHRATVIGSPRRNATLNCWTEMWPAISACNQQDSKNETF